MILSSGGGYYIAYAIYDSRMFKLCGQVGAACFEFSGDGVGAGAMWVIIVGIVLLATWIFIKAILISFGRVPHEGK